MTLDHLLSLTREGGGTTPDGFVEGTSLSCILGTSCIFFHQTNDFLGLLFANGVIVKLYHQQNCCESVSIEDINGDLTDLLFTPLLVFDVRTQSDNNDLESATWTFYTLRTLQGSIDLRWYGTSNGYYSEAVDMDILLPKVPFTAHDQVRLIDQAKSL
jgi:hypothetical protein